MRQLILLAAGALLIAHAAVAQVTMPGMKMPAPKTQAPPRKVAPKKSSANAKGKGVGSARAKSGNRERQQRFAAPHVKRASSMPGMKMPGRAKSKPGAKTPENQSIQNMPGMQVPQGPTMQSLPGMQMPPAHSMHSMPGMTAPEPPVRPPPAAALEGPENAADTVYGTAAMQQSRSFLLTREHGGMTVAKLLIDQLETRVREGADGYFFNAEGWYGGDVDKLWLKSEIEGHYGRSPDRLEIQALWSHAIDPWFDLQTGVRLDGEPRTRGRLVLGVEGLAPYWWEVSAAAFLSNKGDVTARGEAYHDIRVTQKLILQPRTQLDFALQDIPQERVASGLSKAELGARVRYQFVPNLAPFIGIVYERAIGRTSRFVRADGQSPGGLQFTVGLRTWF